MIDRVNRCIPLLARAGTFDTPEELEKWSAEMYQLIYQATDRLKVFYVIYEGHKLVVQAFSKEEALTMITDYAIESGKLPWGKGITGPEFITELNNYVSIISK